MTVFRYAAEQYATILERSYIGVRVDIRNIRQSLPTIGRALAGAAVLTWAAAFAALCWPTRPAQVLPCLPRSNLRQSDGTDISLSSSLRTRIVHLFTRLLSAAWYRDWPARVALSTFGAATLLSTVTQDLRADDQSHGQYYAMFFCALLLMLTIATAFSLLLVKIMGSVGSAARVLLVLMVLTAASWTVAASRAQQTWSRGLNGISLDWFSDSYAVVDDKGMVVFPEDSVTSLRSASGMHTKGPQPITPFTQYATISLDPRNTPPVTCNIARPALSIPWPALLPDGALNFYLGSDKCVKQPHFSRIVNGSVLVVDCPKGDAFVHDSADILKDRPLNFGRALPPDVIARWALDYKRTQVREHNTCHNCFPVTEIPRML